MGKLFVLLGIAAVVYLLIRTYGMRRGIKGPESIAEDMVRCSQCGVHLPRSESIKAGALFYCSLEHRDAAKK